MSCWHTPAPAVVSESVVFARRHQTWPTPCLCRVGTPLRPPQFQKSFSLQRRHQSALSRQGATNHNQPTSRPSYCLWCYSHSRSPPGPRPSCLPSSAPRSRSERTCKCPRLSRRTREALPDLIVTTRRLFGPQPLLLCVCRSYSHPHRRSPRAVVAAAAAPAPCQVGGPAPQCRGATRPPDPRRHALRPPTVRRRRRRHRALPTRHRRHRVPPPGRRRHRVPPGRRRHRVPQGRRRHHVPPGPREHRAPPAPRRHRVSPAPVRLRRRNASTTTGAGRRRRRRRLSCTTRRHLRLWFTTRRHLHSTTRRQCSTLRRPRSTCPLP